jgi:hypothetical protein
MDERPLAAGQKVFGQSLQDRNGKEMPQEDDLFAEIFAYFKEISFTASSLRRKRSFGFGRKVEKKNEKKEEEKNYTCPKTRRSLGGSRRSSDPSHMI